VRVPIAAAIGVAAAAGAFQSNAPALSHEYADVNGVRLHYARAGKGPLVREKAAEVNGLIRDYLGQR